MDGILIVHLRNSRMASVLTGISIRICTRLSYASYLSLRLLVHKFHSYCQPIALHKGRISLLESTLPVMLCLLLQVFSLSNSALIPTYAKIATGPWLSACCHWRRVFGPSSHPHSGEVADARALALLCKLFPQSSEMFVSILNDKV